MADFNVIMRPNRFSAIFDFVESAKKSFTGSQFLTDSHENQHRLSSDQSAQNLSNGFFNVDFVCPLQPIKFGGDGADFRCELISRERFDVSK